MEALCLVGGSLLVSDSGDHFAGHGDSENWLLLMFSEAVEPDEALSASRVAFEGEGSFCSTLWLMMVMGAMRGANIEYETVSPLSLSSSWF